MKKLLCGILCLLMLLGCASAEGYWYAAKGDNGLWGHIDEMGNWVIPPKFDSAGDFRGNYAWIQQGDREGFANRDGEIVLLLDENVVADSGYDGFYYGGRETGIWLLYKKATGKNSLGTEWLEGFFDVQSGVYSGLKWRGVNHRESNSRLIAVADETGKWGYVSRDTGEMVIPAKYDSDNMGSNFYDGYAVVTFWDDDYNIVQTLLLDETGKEYPLPEGINAANCDTVISGGLFEVVDENGLYGYCNTSGEVVIEPQFAYTFEFADGVVCSKRLLNQAVEKSLRTHNLKSKKGAQVMSKNEKITALYERLSRDDFGKDDDQQRESNSISNQKAMLEEFAARQGFTNIVHFTDDGISGTCFDRPGFLAMMKEVEAGNVEYLCIKDMSRMGRDYLKVGQIMEILRQRGVRLIAINDGVDSARGDDDFTPFRNIMNEYYARDTSRKIRSTFQSKGKSGKHLTGTVIYGYLWNEARDQWLVDPEAAEVVKRIFAMTIEGYGPYQIASKLKEEKVLIPSAYLAQHGEGVNKNKTFKDVYGWGSSTICNILEKREYLGHTINFKTRKHFKDKKSHYVPEDEWTIFENTHEAIIDQQTFDLVQKIRGNVRRYPDGWGEAAPLTGLLYCADCGGKMYVHRTNNGKRISQYTCSQYTKVPCGTLCKTQHRINEDVVLSLVSEMLKAIAEYAKHDRAEFVRVVQEAQSSQQTAEVRKQRTRLATAKQRVSELEVLLCKIYEDNILGKLSDSRYATLDAQYEKEQSELTVEISDLEKAIKSYEKHEKDADRFIALIDKYENFDKLTIAMLNEFIEKILVHERDRKGSIQTTQEVEIYFNFVGRFVPPAFGEVELTPEELEEIRKREERKDRLHQNYLKRKASGAQKRYEDKIKKRKKAEIEAKKAAIRAEDIAKGVFVPVSSLPQREPQKGTQIA